MIRQICKCLLILLLAFQQGLAQDTLFNKYGLWVIGNTTMLAKTIHEQPNKLIVSLKKSIPNLVFDLRYAGAENFLQQAVYPSNAIAYLRKIAADSLLEVQQELVKMGFGLKIYDAYRPYQVTEKMWDLVKDARYAADPRKGSGHNRGIAVDCSIVDLNSKAALNMGTGFDNFTDSAHHGFTQLPAPVLNNRKLLRSIMEKHGFLALETEWWHYYLPMANNYELLDLSFRQLKKMSSKKH